MAKFAIQSPWVTYYNMVTKLFELDDKVIIGDIGKWSDKADYEFDITVVDHEKYIAMTQLMPSVIQFGNVTLKINVRDGASDRDYVVEAFKELFKGNRSVRDIKEVADMTGTTHSFVRFEPEVIQFPNDDMTDYNGNWSGLMQDIAREIFDVNSLEISFCTADIRENTETEKE